MLEQLQTDPACGQYQPPDQCPEYRLLLAILERAIADAIHPSAMNAEPRVRHVAEARIRQEATRWLESPSDEFRSCRYICELIAPGAGPSLQKRILLRTKDVLAGRAEKPAFMNERPRARKINCDFQKTA